MRATGLTPSPGTPGEGWGEGDFERRTVSAVRNHPHPNLLPGYREKGKDAPPSLRTKALCAAVMSAAFLICYGGCIAITAARAPVPTLAFAWEKHIPFVPAMIVPYMSMDLIFLSSFFLCTTRLGLSTHVKRLALTIGVATACFLLFPLQMGSHRPVIDGMWALWFAPLDAMDRPYNLAPSLHIAQWTVLWVVYARHTRSWLKALVALWFALIYASTLLTWQHHLLDVVTGQALGLLALYCFRERERSPDEQPAP
jgi:membrane-associated phospholipid phosphatase